MRNLSTARRILVTGASGFVGKYLTAHLQSLQIEPIGWGEDGAAIDIRDATAVSFAIERQKPDAIIHLAAIAAPAAARSNPREAWDVNVGGTFNLAQAVLTHSPDATFVYVGSSESYGTSHNSIEGPIAESGALEPTSVYGATKAAADMMVGQLAREGLRCIRLRPFNHTGPGQAAAYVVSDFARQIAEIEASGGPGLVRVGNLEARRDFLDVRDVVRAYAAAACAETVASGSAINISTGRPLAIRTVLDGLIASSTVHIDVEVEEARMRPNEVRYASGDNSRAASLLGWRPERDFLQTLADVLDDWRAKLRMQA